MSETRLNPEGDPSQFRASDADLGVRDADEIVVSWVGSRRDETGQKGIRFRRFTSDLVPLGDDILVANASSKGTSSYFLRAPLLALTDDGELVFAWTRDMTDTSDEENVWSLEIPDPFATSTEEHIVNTTTGDSQILLDVLGTGARDWVIFWQNEQFAPDD